MYWNSFGKYFCFPAGKQLAWYKKEKVFSYSPVKPQIITFTLQRFYGINKMHIKCEGLVEARLDFPLSPMFMLS